MIDQPRLLTRKFHVLSDGKRMSYALFEPQQPRATLLIAPGRREFIEKKQAEIGTDFLERGFRQIVFEWRGQGLSDRYLSGNNYQRDYITNFDIHLQDLTSFYENVVRPVQTGPLIIVGHSMGAHLLMRWLREYAAGKVNAAIMTAPMMALTGHTLQAVTHGISKVAHNIAPTHYAWGQHDFNEHDQNFSINPLTQDPERFTIIEKYFAANPELTVGGVTWGWLWAALQSMEKVQRSSYFQGLNVPVLTLTGSKDRVTPVSEITTVLSRIAKSENIVIAGALHDLMNELDIYRTQAWQHIDRLLAKVVG